MYVFIQHNIQISKSLDWSELMRLHCYGTYGAWQMFTIAFFGRKEVIFVLKRIVVFTDFTQIEEFKCDKITSLTIKILF